MWISVEDKLPALKQYVLALENNGDIYNVYIASREKAGGKNSEEWYWYDRFESSRLDVTHWIPIPPLPQDENLNHELDDKIYTEEDL